MQFIKIYRKIQTNGWIYSLTKNSCNVLILSKLIYRFTTVWIENGRFDVEINKMICLIILHFIYNIKYISYKYKIMFFKWKATLVLNKYRYRNANILEGPKQFKNDNRAGEFAISETFPNITATEIVWYFVSELSKNQWNRIESAEMEWLLPVHQVPMKMP